MMPGIHVPSINPPSVQAFAQSEGLRSKTDKGDPYAGSLAGKTPVSLGGPHPTERALKALVLRHQALTEIRRRRKTGGKPRRRFSWPALISCWDV